MKRRIFLNITAHNEREITNVDKSTGRLEADVKSKRKRLIVRGWTLGLIV